ncbi:MAG: serine/threonine-protein kinase, partial [Planctomycetota bacterium]|nr:serine/threonine-protein kinase [Planctomycetota bacterium]
MSSTSTPLDHTEDGRAFLQKRVGRFGLYGTALGMFFLLVRLAMATAGGQLLDELDPSFTYHVLAMLSLGAIWLVCLGGPRSVRVLRWTESVGLFLACSSYAAMGHYIPLVARPHFIVLLALALGLIARAIYVPSSLQRTLWLTSLCGVPLFIVTYLLHATMDIEPWLHVAPEIEQVGVEGITRATLISALAWWASVVWTCAGASAVIYGLRHEVRSARKLGQYTLEGKLGQGAMGAVYRASHAMLRRPTAVKLLPKELAGAQHVARFEKEVQLTAMLTHPNTVTIYDYGRTPEGVFYYAMELLDGVTLRDIVEVDGPQAPNRVASILNQVAGALSEAHDAGLMHRDIKPANIMLVEQSGKPDVAKVLDFGLVKELETAPDAGVTLAGTITGTPQYLA